MLRSLALASLAAVALAAQAPAQSFHGPSPYLSEADSPFDLSGLGSTAFLENFEDASLNTPGLHSCSGSPYGPDSITDSVDGDDGNIDGSGNGGRSYLGGDMTFTFSLVELGALPTFAGIVWTDGGSHSIVTFEAFDANGDSIGTVVDPDCGDNFINGTTAEDRFFGVESKGGISSFTLKGSGSAEVDHVQYGGLPPENELGCYADCDGDSALSLFDFLCFVNAFNAGSAYANCDPSGCSALDLFDFLCYTNAFNAGCP